MARVFPEGRLVYGMQLPIQSQSTIYAEPWEATAGAADLAAVARAADRAGFGYVATCDHVAIPRRMAGPMSTIWYDPVATLSFLAGITENVRLLSHVAILGLRHPLLSAKQYATVDHLSGGRLILGVGAGHVQEEFEVLGVDFARRGAVLDETLDALRAALGPEEYPEFEGELFSFKDLGQLPRPVQTRIPVWVGGSSPAAVRRAAVRGDGWLRRATRATSSPRRSPASRSSARGPGSPGPSSSGRSPRRSTWASPAGTPAAGPSPARRRRSPSRCASTRRWASTRSRSASATATGPNSSTRSRLSGPKWARYSTTSH